jgi:lysophospholipase L1-like esterase
MDYCLQVWGDSLFKGVIFDEVKNRYVIHKDNCVNKLKDFLPFPMMNYSRMGCTAAKALDKIEREIIECDGLALIEFGGNDCDVDWAAVANDPDFDHQPTTQPTHFAAHLEELVVRIRGAGMRIILAVPTPLYAPRYFDWVTQGLNKSAVLSFLGDVHRIYRWQELYAVAVLRTAAKLDCLVLDLRTPFLERKNYENLLCVDGIHPNIAGHELMFQAMKTGFADI